MRIFTCINLLLLLTITAFTQRTSPGSQKELAEISERGRDLYAYDEAAWHSTDAVIALNAEKGSFETYIGQKKKDKWIVAFGKLNAERNAYLIIYEALEGSPLNNFAARKLEKPKQDKGFYLSAALAIELAKADFGLVDRPYNIAVLPATSGQLFVYFVPAQTVNGIFPLGGDVRYLIRSDGQKILEKRQLHKSIIEFRTPEGVKPESGFHTAIMDDIPEDTDVFHLLTRRPAMPELIMTNKYVYQVKADGSIVYLMTREAFSKIVKAQN